MHRGRCGGARHPPPSARRGRLRGPAPAHRGRHRRAGRGSRPRHRRPGAAHVTTVDPDSLDLPRLLEVALHAARAGGAIVLDAFGAARDIRSKGPGDWVSATDTASERAVRACLIEGAPDLPVFGEEEGGDRAEVGWLVDPLDGTANFL
ncbi:MAG: hypothetical protein FJW95_08680, partial [Actinobacteria bacterium]|nr:hypothetical protein [Actinomycetota bacterium]